MIVALRVAAMAAGLLLLLPFHLAWRLSGRRATWPRLFLRLVARAAGLRVRVEGKPLGTRVLFLVNHVSWLDIVALGGVKAPRFVSKDEVQGWPLVGWLARLADTLFIARAERGAVREQAETLRRALEDGRPVALFPEGTTGDGRSLLPFRSSLLNALWPPLPGVMVQPVAIDFGARAPDIAWPEASPFPVDAKRLLSGPPIDVTLRFLDSIDPADHADRKQLAAAVRRAIAAALPASAATADPL